ncbi:MAG: Gfo/Idh/MocA family oxidoreductase [Rhodobacteraceae bacterium]|nr:Gfo/Idh/MocA family oxidoreductase [Paracoccaceae bacterium]
MPEPLRVGLVGCGHISATYLRLAPMFRGYRITAVADVNAQAAQARAQEFGLPARGVEELLNAADIDLVLNLTPPTAHAKLSRASLNAGKHVYSEKPFVLSIDEGRDLTTLAKQNGLRIGAAPDTFLGGAQQLARALVDQERCGPIASGTAVMMSRGMEHWHPNPDFFYQPGAGPVLDIGPYYLCALVNLLGPVRQVAAFALSAWPTRTIGNGPRQGEMIPVSTPTTFHALLTFESGTLLTLLLSWDVCSHGHNPIELYGSQATLYVPDPNFFGGQARIGQADGRVETPSWDHPLLRPNNAQDQANYRGAGLADMALAIAEGRAHRCAQDLALHGVEVMTALLESADSGRVIPMTTSCTRPDALAPEAARALFTHSTRTGAHP